MRSNTRTRTLDRKSGDWIEKGDVVFRESSRESAGTRGEHAMIMHNRLSTRLSARYWPGRGAPHRTGTWKNVGGEKEREELRAAPLENKRGCFALERDRRFISRGES